MFHVCYIRFSWRARSRCQCLTAQRSSQQSFLLQAARRFPPTIPPPKPAPLPVPTSVTITGERFELLTLTGYDGQVTWDVTAATVPPPVVLFEKVADTVTTGWRVGATKPDKYPIGKSPTVEVWAVGVGEATVSAWGVNAGNPVKLASFKVVANTAPQPPPTPEPKPPEPAPPVTVTSFRVFLVYEAGATLTAEQYGILYGADVEKALITACNIPNASGWRRLDKDANPASPRPDSRKRGRPPSPPSRPCRASPSRSTRRSRLRRCRRRRPTPPP